MKIKITWSEEDIKSGLYIVRTDQLEISDTGSLSTVLYKIGWHVNRIETILFKDNKSFKTGGATKDGDYCLISMSDGMVSFITPRKDMVDFLNSDDKNYRIASKEEVIRVINYQDSLSYHFKK